MWAAGNSAEQGRCPYVAHYSSKDIIGTVKGLTIIGAALGLFVALLSGCKKDIHNTDAVRQGIMSYLATRSDLLAMDVSLTSVAFRQNEATATVRFQAKGNSSPG